jgi:hypothetical protein
MDYFAIGLAMAVTGVMPLVWQVFQILRGK